MWCGVVDVWSVELCGQCVEWCGECVECSMVCVCMCGVVWCVFPVCVVVDVCTHTWVVCVHIHHGRRLTLSDSIIESVFM